MAASSSTRSSPRSCGFAQSAVQLAVFRVLLGLGMGGEWATRRRARVGIACRQAPRARRSRSCRAPGRSAIGLAALVNRSCCRVWGWRGVFFVGVLPALFTLWIRRNVEEPEIWRRAGARPNAVAFGHAVHAGHRRRARSRSTLMNACTLFGWWGLNSWVPGVSSSLAGRAGRHRLVIVDDVAVRDHDAGGHVVRLRHVRLRRRRDRPEAHLRDLHSRRRACCCRCTAP